MSVTFEQATDEILILFKAAWDTTTFDAFYENVADDRDDSEDPYCQVWIRHTAGAQRTMGAPGGRRFNRTGILLVQLYCPSGKGLQESYRLAKVLADAFEGSRTPGDVWFRNTKIDERQRDGNFRRLDFTTEFSYDEIK